MASGNNMRQANLSPVFVFTAERHCIGAFFRPLGPYREPISVPVEDLDAVLAPVREHEEMPGDASSCMAPVTNACSPSKLRRMSQGEVPHYTRTLAGR